MDDTHRDRGDSDATPADASQVDELAAVDPADAPAAAERLADRLQAMLDEAGEPNPDPTPS